MIVKQRDTHDRNQSDPLSIAGAKAEEQMAFYLRRAFESSPGVLVFNDLRLPNDRRDDHAQLDHLVLCRGGMVIIESKSVTSAVRINERGEWTRQWNGAWRGMPSPIQQAKVQADFLRELLQSRREMLRSKAIFGMVQKGFQFMPIDILIAISDRGRVEQSGEFQEVLKSDQVVDRVREIVERRDVGFLRAALKNDDQAWMSLTDEELERLRAFLFHHHRPFAPQSHTTFPSDIEVPPKTESTAAVLPIVAPEAKADSASAACRHCQSTRLNIAYGKYGYYFKCLACDKNTPIDLNCPTCGTKSRVRKDGLKFFKDCNCVNASAFHTNQPT